MDTWPDDRDIELWREAYRSLQSHGSPSCPPDDRLIALVLHEHQSAGREQLADHIVSCRRCTDLYQILLRVHRDFTETRPDPAPREVFDPQESPLIELHDGAAQLEGPPDAGDQRDGENRDDEGRADLHTVDLRVRLPLGEGGEEVASPENRRSRHTGQGELSEFIAVQIVRTPRQIILEAVSDDLGLRKYARERRQVLPEEMLDEREMRASRSRS